MGSDLQADLDRLNAEDPVEFVPWFLGAYRHLCSGARQAKPDRPVSTTLTLKERYVPDENNEFAIVYKEGTCSKCGLRVRSKEGHIVRMTERPPLEGRVAR